MKTGNIHLGADVHIHESSNINNAVIDDGVKIAKRCSIFGGASHPVHIGGGAYVGMNTIINGYAAPVSIGKHCSIAQNVNIMADSGPNASERMQRIFPLVSGPVSVGDHTWIGEGVVVMPGVAIGKFCVVAAKSFVNRSFGDYLVIGGSPARVIRPLSQEEINEVIR